jgi:hypothetical protein
VLSPTYAGFVFETGACFVAGTLVHTNKGLVPIEQIKVGDLVLSKPESGEGEVGYKPVVETFVHQDKEIARIDYKLDNDSYTSYPLHATWDHPFWVAGEGWTAAARLHGPWLSEHKLELTDGSHVTVDDNCPVYRTSQPGVGWFGNRNNRQGAEVDFRTMKGISNNALLDYDIVECGDCYLKTTVYNFEVEDYHTYFVGEHGVWVHNANCAGVELWKGGVPSETILPDGTKLFESQSPRRLG